MNIASSVAMTSSRHHGPILPLGITGGSNETMKPFGLLRHGCPRLVLTTEKIIRQIIRGETIDGWDQR